MKVYFDNAATTPLHPKVIEVMNKYLAEEFGNPSSIHSFGRKTRVLVEEARERIARFIGANANEIYFTSGGTEANNFVIFGISKCDYCERKRNSILVSRADHYSVLDAALELSKNGFSIQIAEVDSTTKILTGGYKNLLSNSTSIVSFIHVNNETGSINEIKKLASHAHDVNSYFHSDAVQSFGKIPINVKELDLDSLTASAHKIHGPKGIGIAYVKSGTPVNPLIIGGSQERNRRGGTENVAAIAGFAEAVRIAALNMKINLDHVRDLKKVFLEGIKVIDNTGIKINGSADAVPYIASITFLSEYYQNDAEAMLIFLDIHGIAASNGAACTSGTLKPSHVILASGYNEDDARGTIRFSFSVQNTLNEVNYTLEILNNLARKFRK
jgi:cysteine desulfurase